MDKILSILENRPPQRFGAAASKYAGKIRAFVESYLITERESGMVPFGGRDPEFEILDRWLADEKAEARFILAAPAGRGKSVLLVHWINRLLESGQVCQAEGRWNLAFVPISMRFGTNLPQIFYEALAARLAEILSQDLEPAHTDPEAYYQDKCRELLDDAIAKQTRILLVIDGLDEALGASFDARWFPRRVGTSLRLLVLARLEVGEQDVRDWVERLHWSSGVRVRTHDLRILGPGDIEDLLRKTGASVDVQASWPEISNRLYELSEGEPLLLSLYVEDLWKRNEEAARLTIEDLERIKRGLSGYFEDWMRRQRELICLGPKCQDSLAQALAHKR